MRAVLQVRRGAERVVQSAQLSLEGPGAARRPGPGARRLCPYLAASELDRRMREKGQQGLRGLVARSVCPFDPYRPCGELTCVVMTYVEQLSREVAARALAECKRKLFPTSGASSSQATGVAPLDRGSTIAVTSQLPGGAPAPSYGDETVRGPERTSNDHRPGAGRHSRSPQRA